MITATDVAELRRHLAAWRGAGQRIAFVPTMGALHEGHLALVRRARELVGEAPGSDDGGGSGAGSDAGTGSGAGAGRDGGGAGGGRVVVSVFVNPTQFDRADDLQAYPRDVERDAALLRTVGTDLLFLPEVEAIYPPGDATRVDVAGPAEGLEGEHRPGHFRGVATVVTRLFNLVQPDLAVFGRKDAQQLAVVQRMVRDLHQPVEIVPHPTVREDDGLALSSRNARLAPEDRRRAVLLHRALLAARAAVEAGERDAGELRLRMGRVLTGESPGGAGDGPLGAAEAGAVDRIEYAEVVDGATFQPLHRLPDAGTVVLPVAAWVGGVRLIDNLALDMSDLHHDQPDHQDRSPKPPVPADGGGAVKDA